MIQLSRLALLLAVSSALHLPVHAPAHAQTSEPQTSEPQAADPQTADEPETKRLYVGVGVNFGVGGDESALSDEGFAIVTRTQIFEYLAVRGSFVFGDGVASATALTGQYPISNSAGKTVAVPFLGGGFSVASGDFNPLLSAGVDVPLSEDFTLTNRVNVSFDDDTDVGALVGVGYNFNLF